jgi:hypothetical protein
MSSEPPPNPQVSTFNPAFWNITADNGLTTQFLDANYLKFPFSQSAVETFVVSPQCSATQPAPTDSSNKIPTTAWVQSAIGTGSVPNLQGVLNLGNTATGASATIGLTNSGVGYTSNPSVKLYNSNATGGNLTGVPSIEYYKSGRNTALNDVIMSQQFNALDYTGVKQTFGKIECSITGASAGTGIDGALDFYSCVNGANNIVFRMNGADNENNCFRPLDMVGNAIKTSTLNLSIDATASSGTGNIIIAPKTATGGIVDIQGDATLLGTRDITFGGGTTITNIIDRTGLLINNVNTQSIYQDANCNLLETDTPNNSIYANTNTPQSQLIRRIDLTSGSDIQRNQSNLVQTKLEYTDIATGDQSSIRLENDLTSLNNVIGQNYTTGAGAVLETILQTTPSGQHGLSMTNNNTLFSTSLNTTQLLINDTANNKSITIDNNPSSTQNRIDLFKNDGGGISTQLAIVNTTGLQTLALAHTDNANGKSIGIQNTRAGVGEISWTNTIDSNPLNITSNQSLNLTAQGAVGISSQANTDITSAGGNINFFANTATITFATTALDFTGAGLQSNTSSGNSGEHLVITLNGVQYKIALQNP